MIKFVSPSGWSLADRNVQPIKLSRRGLIGNDRSSFLKFASPAFLPLVDELKFAEDEYPVHIIAMGATEAYGPNRNGDGFKEAMLRACTPSFEKYAYYFRRHKNKDPLKSYGTVKRAIYNEDMRRTELLALLNKTAAAAKRNHGLVADAEIEKLARGEDVPTSMAACVPYDTCSGCGNRAKTKKDYCDESQCKYGGLKKNICKVAEDGHYLHADNPRGKFFDISTVPRGADAISTASTADYLLKSATDAGLPGLILPSAVAEELYGGDAPAMTLAEKVAEDPTLKSRALLISAMAKIADDRDADMTDAVCREPWPQHVLDAIGQPGTKRAADNLAYLADQGLVMSLSDFANWSGAESDVDSAQTLLPEVYKTATDNAHYADRLLSRDFDMSEAGDVSASFKKRAESLSETHAFVGPAVRRNILRSGLSGGLVSRVKIAQDIALIGGPETSLALDYSTYKLAALERVGKLVDNFLPVAALAHSQNCVN